jgi:hypothetical protein
MNTKNEQVAQEITRCLSSKIDIANSKTRIEIEKMITDEVWINNNYWNVADATPRETALAFYLTMTDKD